MKRAGHGYLDELLGTGKESYLKNKIPLQPSLLGIGGGLIPSSPPVKPRHAADIPPRIKIHF